MSFKLKKNSVQQKIDLKELMGVDFKNEPALREAIGQAMIEKIRANVEKGNGVSFKSNKNGRKVKLKSPYSDEYKNSLEFKAHGKSENHVNMKLTGDMMGLIDIVKQNSNSITLGWEDEEQNNKAYNHIKGDTIPFSRPFFGLNKAMLKEVKSEFKPKIKELLKSKQNESREAFNNKILDLLKAIGTDNVG